MALQIASLFASLGLDDNLTQGLKNAEKNLTGFSGKLSSLGGDLQNMGSKLMAATAPIAGLLGAATKTAMDFDEAMTNVGAVMGASSVEIAKMSAEILKIGGDSRAGPQAVAEAFYDIVGGVTDASSRMAILNAAIKTSEAGNSELAGTTKALIAVMNSYSFTANQAGFASDVLTRTVGMGVGTMDEFASALPTVAGLANSLGISFDKLGGMMAYVTTKGFTASEASTQLRAMMTSLLNPNEKMKTALKAMGFESGQAAIKQLGLIGVFKEMKKQGFENDLAGIVGSTEALNGVITLTNESAGGFLKDFKGGIEGATAAAQEVQMNSAAAQFDLLKASVSELAITVGTALLPVFKDIVEQIKPVIAGVTDWINKNPEATATLLKIAGVALVAGPAFIALGGAIKGVSAAIGILLSPAGLLLVTIAGIVYYIEKNYKGGFLQMLTDAATTADQLRQLIGIAVVNAFDALSTAASNALRDIIKFVQDMGVEVRRVAGTIGVAFINIANAIISAFWNVGQAIGNFVLDRISTALQLLTIIQAALGDTAAAKRTADAVLGLKGSNTSPPVIGIPDWMLNYAGGRAMGGAVTAGRSYTVGERGPELFVPGQSGAIIPNGRGRTANITLILRADNFEERIYNNVAVALE